MDQTQKKSRRLVWIALIAVVVVGVIVGAIFFILLGSTTEPQAATTSSFSSVAEDVASKEEVQQNLTTLDAGIKQAASDQEIAKAALKDNEKQIKVGK